MDIDWESIDDGVINAEEGALNIIGFDEKAQKEVVEGVFRLAGPILHFVLAFFDDDYKEASDGEDFNFTDTLKWLMASNWMSYFSDITLQMMGTLVYDFTQDDWAGAEKALLEWWQERVTHLILNPKPFDWLIFFPQLLLHNWERFFGKLSVMNVAFTAIPWTIIGPIPTLVQIFFMVFENKFYAQGNVLLLGIQAVLAPRSTKLTSRHQPIPPPPS